MGLKFTILLIFFITDFFYCQLNNYRVSNPATGFPPEEVSVTINRNNPDILAAGANIAYFYSSFDGGFTWQEKTLTSSLGVWGDPCLLFDRYDNLYFAHLSNPINGYWIDRIVVQKSTDFGVTWNDGAGIGLTSPRNQDKEWLAIDYSDSEYKDRIYMFWTEFDEYGSSSENDSTRILFSKSTDFGETWSEPLRISDIGGNCIDEDETVEGAVPAVGPNGELYTAWSGPLGIMFDRSFDGGETFGEDIFISTQPGGWDFVVPGIYRTNGMPVTAVDVSNSPYRGTIYVMWSDQRNGNTDIFISESSDSGNTWSSAKKVNDDNSNKHQFFPWMSIDSETGYIWIVFYDRRNTKGLSTDVYIARSTDGGETFVNYPVSNESFTPNSSVFFGDYINIDAYKNNIVPIWTRMDEYELSIWTAPFKYDSSIVSVNELNISFLNFEVNKKDFSVVLSWEVDRLDRIDSFEILKSNNKYEWFLISNITEFNINASSIFTYSDYNKKAGDNYYKIKALGKDKFKESDILNIEIEENNRKIVFGNFPNPFNSSTTVYFNSYSQKEITLNIFNVLGQNVKNIVLNNLSEGYNEFSIDFEDLDSGVYFVSSNFNGQKNTIKAINLK